ncbi:MAG: hypothetical protein ABWZ02_10070, partial [Nakamurella sp.]
MTTSERTAGPVDTGDFGNEPESTPAPTRAPSLARRLAISLLFAVAVLAVSVVTVLRYTAPALTADGVGQSLFSVQDVDLFFWGQNRFAAVVSWLASPVADPMLNLFLCLLINAVSVHVLLVVVAWMGVRLVAGRRTWQATFVLFLMLTAVTHLILKEDKIYSLALESQPFPLSWALALGAFLLWKRTSWWAFALAAVMVGIAVGLN